MAILQEVMTGNELLNGEAPILFVAHRCELQDDVTVEQDFEDYR